MTLGGSGVVPSLHQVAFSTANDAQGVQSSGVFGVFQSPLFRPLPLRGRVNCVGARFLLAVAGKAIAPLFKPAKVIPAIRVPLRAMRETLRGESTLLNGVLSVVLRRSGEQVGGVDAPTIVAPMAHEHPVRNRAVVQLIGKTVGSHAHVVDAQLPVRKAVNRSAAPRPAACPEGWVQRPVRVGLGPKPRKQIGAYSHTANITRSRWNIPVLLDGCPACGGLLPGTKQRRAFENLLRSQDEAKPKLLPPPYSGPNPGTDATAYLGDDDGN
jgi:hypothetical protein